MKKYFEIAALITLILIANVFFASPIVSIYNFTRIENEELKEDTLQAKKIIEAEAQQLNITAGDYAGWDDAYNFMYDGNQKFIHTSLGETFYSKLHLNLFCMIAEDGTIVFSRANDYINNIQRPFPASLLPHLKPGSQLLKHGSPQSSVAGFVSLPEGLLMVASRPILTTEYKGPPRGTLIIGRFFDRDETLKLSNLLGYKIEVLNTVSNEKNLLFKDELSRFSSQNSVLLHTTQDERIIGHVQLIDIYGQVAGLVKLEKSRIIYHKAKSTAWFMILLYCVLSLAVGVVYWLLRSKLAIVRRNKEEVKEQLHSFIELAVDGIFKISGSGDILLVNSSVCEMTGYARDELQGTQISRIFVAGETGEFKLAELMQQDSNKALERTLLSKGGQQIIVELSVKKMPDNTIQGVIHDVSANKAMERELIEYRNRISSMSIEVSVAEERERNRIAGELHDQVGPNLLLGKLKIDQLQAHLPDAVYDDEFEAAKEFISKSIQDIRSLTFQLRPPILANAGLEAALKWLAQDFGQHHGIQVSLQHDETPVFLEYSIRVTLFQAVRELLQNVLKHASARHVLITVRNDPGIVILSVGDDGVGFQVPRDYAMHSNSFGLFNTLQRIKYHGGQMHIDSSPGLGTRVFITIPLVAAASI